jgi:hypothetical protein
MSIRSSCVAAALVVGVAVAPTIARADLVLLGSTIPLSFVDIGALGFGHDPRLLTLQETHAIETGTVAPNGTGGVVLSGDAVSGSNKASAPTVGFLGWTNGSMVGIGFNTDQTGNNTSGITLQSLTMTLYNGTTVVGTFPIDPTLVPLNFSATNLALQQGNGNGVFEFVLNSAEQATFTGLVTAAGGSGLTIGLSSSLGCAPGAPASCLPSNDGPDSFLAIARPGSLALVPLPPAALLFGTALVGMGILGRRRRKGGLAQA